MPELPEVETIKNVLKPHIIGRTVSKVTVRNSAAIAYPAVNEFASALNGQVFADFTRRGKFLEFGFESGDSLVLHLRMTGSLMLASEGTPYEKHEHLALSLDDGSELRYEDPRRFGRFWYIKSGTPDTITGRGKLGYEPFSKELTPEYLRAKFARSKTVKELLLDQSIVAGIGNIYSDEICFHCGVRPDRVGISLTGEELERILVAIPERQAYFIDKNQIPLDDYIKSRGKDYRNTPYLQVYGKGGKPCPKCGALLERKTIGGRSSVYCPKCQL